MGNSVRVRAGSSSGWVMFRLSDILGHFNLGLVWFDSGQFRVDQFLVKCTHHAKTRNFLKKFGWSMIRFRSIKVSGPLSGEHIMGVGSGIGPGCLVQVSGLRSVLPSLF